LADMILFTTKSRTGRSIFFCYPISFPATKPITAKVFHEVSWIPYSRGGCPMSGGVSL
jgi:hypothetical protein